MSADGIALTCGAQTYRVADIAGAAGDDLERLPVILRILLENVLRNTRENSDAAVSAIRGWLEHGRSEREISFLPLRVLMHDTTCGPALVDIAAMRSSLAEAGGDPNRLNPVLPVDVSTDHSIGVDVFGRADAMKLNIEHEFHRNAERYRFMKWATRALDGVPLLTGYENHQSVTALGTGVRPLARVVVGAGNDTGDRSEGAIAGRVIGTYLHGPVLAS